MWLLLWPTVWMGMMPTSNALETCISNGEKTTREEIVILCVSVMTTVLLLEYIKWGGGAHHYGKHGPKFWNITHTTKTERACHTCKSKDSKFVLLGVRIGNMFINIHFLVHYWIRYHSKPKEFRWRKDNPVSIMLIKSFCLQTLKKFLHHQNIMDIYECSQHFRPED